MKIMLKKCYETYSPQPGVTFYINQYYECFDLDVDDEVESLLFDFDAYGLKFQLRGLFKQFPNVKTIKISSNITSYLELSNFMFPNVEHVESKSLGYKSGPFLVYLDWNNKLLNTFCKKVDYVIDLYDIDEITDYAFEGCMSTNIVNGDNVNDYLGIKSKSFYGSAYLLKHLNYENILSFYNVLVGIDRNADVINIPEIIKYIPAGIDFGNVKVVYDNIMQVKGNNLPKHIHIMKGGSVLRDIINLMEYHQVLDLTIEENDAGVLIENGLLLSKDKTIVYRCLASKSGAVFIPDGVQTIKAHAFINTNITSVTLPESMRSIEKYAFVSCQNLKSIHLNKELNEIGDSVFTKCYSLSHIELPAGLKTIHNNVFAATGLESIVIPQNIQCIHRNAFSFNSSLKNITIETSSLKILGPIFSNVKEIVFADNVTLLPKSLFDIFDDEYSDSNQVTNPVIKLKHKGKIVFVPRYIKKAKRDVLNDWCSNETIDEFFEDKRYDFMYKMTAELTLKYFTALETYLYNRSEDIGKYLRRVSKNLAQFLIANEDETRLIQFLNTGMLSKHTLNILLQIAQDKGLDTVSAYILNAINGKCDCPKFNL